MTFSTIPILDSSGVPLASCAYSESSTFARLEPDLNGAMMLGMSLDWSFDLPSYMVNKMSPSGYMPAVYNAWLDITPGLFNGTGFDGDMLNWFGTEVGLVGGMLELSVNPQTANVSQITVPMMQALAEKCQIINEQYGVPIYLRYGHEMNGDWYPWGNAPTLFIASFRQLTGIIREYTNMTAMVWAPNIGITYPFVGGGARESPSPGGLDFDVLDTNHDGVINGMDDPYTPFYPGDDVVDWVGISLYYYPTCHNDCDVPNGYLVYQLTGVDNPSGSNDSAWLAVHNFYQMFSVARNKPLMFPETGAPWISAFAIVSGATTETTLKQEWWSQIFSENSFTNFPKFKFAVQFEEIKPLDLGDGLCQSFELFYKFANQAINPGTPAVQDWRVTNNSNTLNWWNGYVQSIRSDLKGADQLIFSCNGSVSLGQKTIATPTTETQGSKSSAVSVKLSNNLIGKKLNRNLMAAKFSLAPPVQILGSNGAPLPSCAYSSTSGLARLEPDLNGVMMLGMSLDWSYETPIISATKMIPSSYVPAVYNAWLDITPGLFNGTGFDINMFNWFGSEVGRVGGMLELSLNPQTPNVSQITVPMMEAFAAKCQNINEQYGVPIFLRYGHEMNGDWYPWGNAPTLFIASFRQFAGIIRQYTNMTAMVWAPNIGITYPFVGGGARESPSPGGLDFDVLDTNHDGVINGMDDPYTPFYPGDDVVDWVGISLYYYPLCHNDCEVPANIFIEQLTGVNDPSGSSDPAWLAVHNFYQMFSIAHSKPLMLPETGSPWIAAWANLSGAVPETEVKQGWWSQIFSENSYMNLTKFRFVVQFEEVKPLDLDGTPAIQDWRVTNNTADLNWWNGYVQGISSNLKGSDQLVYSCDGAVSFGVKATATVTRSLATTATTVASVTQTTSTSGAASIKLVGGVLFLFFMTL
ncbi:hypothetical protein HK100_003682 [Physocladia obscura]|uniref:GH26 domain-containing protein n=1 Tax=Physocladia obscura TaxID=109957 RepID=A0AAD5STZ3_9FUNG|nr:hypothetical protein HK100_003682 [Physocladia obscura]